MLLVAGALHLIDRLDSNRNLRVRQFLFQNDVLQFLIQLGPGRLGLVRQLSCLSLDRHNHALLVVDRLHQPDEALPLCGIRLLTGLLEPFRECCQFCLVTLKLLPEQQALVLPQLE